MKSTLLAALVAALGIGAGSLGFSQEDADPPVDEAGAPADAPMPANMQEMMKQQLKQMTEQQRVRMHGYMRIKIDDMQRVCELSDDQVKKLELASKGAVGLAMEKWKKQMEQMQGQMFGQVQFMDVAVAGGVAVRAVDDAPAAEEPEEPEAAQEELKLAQETEPDEPAAEGAADAVAIAPAVPMMPAMAFGGMWGAGPGAGAGGLAAAVNEPVWIKTVDKVLMPEQVKAYKKALADRTAFRRKATLQDVLASLDDQLLFSPAQREQLGKLIDTTMGAQFEAPRGDGMGFAAMFLSQTLQQISAEKVQGFLSKPQVDRWQEMRSGAMPGMGGGLFFPPPLRVDAIDQDALEAP